jgi:hypothetical protein
MYLTYRMDANEARIPVSHTQDKAVSTLSMLRRHVYIFRNWQGFKVKLEQQLKATGMKQRLLVLDMLVLWNSTSNMISVVYVQEGLITAVCTSQTINLSVCNIMLNQNDYEARPGKKCNTLAGVSLEFSDGGPRT